jgi:predicted amino acid racemase
VEGRNELSYPRLYIDKRKVFENARFVVSICKNLGIEVVGVTKATCANRDVVHAMLAAGMSSLGDSRIKNIARLKKDFSGIKTMMLRIPSISEAEMIVAYADCSLVSEISTVKELNRQAHVLGKKHEIILMIELGDLREGIMPEDVIEFLKDCSRLDNIKVTGIGTNLACYGGLIPTVKILMKLVEIKIKASVNFGIDLEIISGGSSSSLPLVYEGTIPGEVNQLRIGESILLGVNVIDRKPFSGLHLDAFVIEVEVIEFKKKPSKPIGNIGMDAFGSIPLFDDKGEMYRVICAIGRQDAVLEGLRPMDHRLEVLGGSSDHLIMAVTDGLDVRVGDVIRFIPNYSALLAAFTSDYVEKVVI